MSIHNQMTIRAFQTRDDAIKCLQQLQESYQRHAPYHLQYRKQNEQLHLIAKSPKSRICAWVHGYDQPNGNGSQICNLCDITNQLLSSSFEDLKLTLGTEKQVIYIPDYIRQEGYVHQLTIDLVSALLIYFEVNHIHDISKQMFEQAQLRYQRDGL